MIPDIEKVVSNYLRDQDLDTRFVLKTPPSTSGSWVRVTQIGAADEPTSKAEYLITFLMQFDCYAGNDGGQPEASLLARSVRAALHGAPHDQGDTVISAVRFTGHLRLPDQDFEPARERFILSALVTAHTTPGS